MNHRVTATILCVFSLVAIAVGYFLLHPSLLGLCSDPSRNCLSEFWRYGIGKPLFWSTYWLPIFFFALMFIRKEVFQSWWKFAAIFSILPLLLIIV